MNVLILIGMILSVLSNPTQHDNIKENGLCHAIHMQYSDDAEAYCSSTIK